MSDAELWLLEIEMNVGLSPDEKKQLYKDYVKDFKQDKSKGKAIQKTLNLIQKR